MSYIVCPLVAGEIGTRLRFDTPILCIREIESFVFASDRPELDASDPTSGRTRPRLELFCSVSPSSPGAADP